DHLRHLQRRTGRRYGDAWKDSAALVGDAADDTAGDLRLTCGCEIWKGKKRHETHDGEAARRTSHRRLQSIPVSTGRMLQQDARDAYAVSDPSGNVGAGRRVCCTMSHGRAPVNSEQEASLSMWALWLWDFSLMIGVKERWLFISAIAVAGLALCI